jgi:hypothetical protein
VPDADTGRAQEVRNKVDRLELGPSPEKQSSIEIEVSRSSVSIVVVLKGKSREVC